MSAPLRLVLMIATRPGMGAQQVEAFAKLAPTVRAERGCLQYDLHQVGGDPDRFVLLERWSDEAALQAHNASAHMRDADAANASFRAGPPTMLRLDDAPVA